MDKHQHQLELSKRVTEYQQKYIYFLLAVNGSAIGFTVQLIIREKITSHLWILLLAIVTWAVSFFCGCKYLLNAMTVFNIDLHNAITNVQLPQREIANNKIISNFNWMFRL